MKTKLLLTIALCTIFGCAFAANQHGFKNTIKIKSHNNSIKNVKDTITPILGGGYSNDMQSPVLACLNDNGYKLSGGSKTVISLGKAYDFGQIEKDLNVDVSSSLSMGIYSADASANYAKHVKETSYSESFYYLEQIILPTKTFQFSAAKTPEDFLNDKGKLFYGMGPNQFRMSCGDAFFYQTPMGATLFISLKMDFKSLHDRSSFDTHVSGGVGDIFNASADIENAVNKYNINGSLEVSAYQIGGKGSHLATIFTKGKDHYYVATCNLKHLDACKNIVDGAINYAETDFKDQVNLTESGDIPKNAVPLSYTPFTYAQIGLTDSSSTVTPEIIAARKVLGDTYKQTKKESDFVDHILTSSAKDYIVKDSKDKLEQAQTDLHDNLALLNDSSNGAIGCYLHPKQCVAIKNRLIGIDGKSGELTPVDKQLLTEFNTGYIGGETNTSYLTTTPHLLGIPLGGNQFLFLMPPNMGVWSTGTVTVESGGQSLYLYLVDHGVIVKGHLAKIGDDTYAGTAYFSDGTTALMHLAKTSNPI